MQSFTKADLKKVCNGGPFTIEIHDTVFRNSEGEKKTAALIKTFIDLGGHQIQINAINRDTLIDAQKHPEKYPNLIVRVWGWSGYFPRAGRLLSESYHTPHGIRLLTDSFKTVAVIAVKCGLIGMFGKQSTQT